MSADETAGGKELLPSSPARRRKQRDRVIFKASVPGQPMTARELTEEDLDRAEQFYLKNKEAFEKDHWDQYVAVDVDDGRNVVGSTRLAAAASFRSQFGSYRSCCTFHVGTTR